MTTSNFAARTLCLAVAVGLLLSRCLGQPPPAPPGVQILSAQDDAVSAFLGTYSPEQACTPSATCCCATSPVTITRGSSDGMIAASGSMDGGAACVFQTSLVGQLQVRNASYASADILGYSIAMRLRFDVLLRAFTVAPCAHVASRCVCWQRRQRDADDPGLHQQVRGRSGAPVADQRKQQVRFLVIPS